MLAASLLLVLATGCAKSAGATQDEYPNFTSYRDIPGVTPEEIAAISALAAQHSSFVYGMNLSTEAFKDDDGTIMGYSALFCKWLSDLFGIPFKPAIYEWDDLLAGLKNGEIDFTGELAPTEENLGADERTSAIAERSVKYMQIANSMPLSEIAEFRPLRYAFLQGTNMAERVAALETEPFETYMVEDFAQAYTLLKSGWIDAFFDEGTAEAAFDAYGDVVAKDYVPLIYEPVSLATQNPDLRPIISVMQKALDAGVIRSLTGLYNQGQQDYRKHKLMLQLTTDEKNYLRYNQVVNFVAEYDNYPISFYNTHDKQWQGIAFDTMQEVEKLTGLTFQMVNDQHTEWSDLLKMLEDGDASMVTELIPSNEREGLFLWPKNAIFTDNYALISKSEKRNININEILYMKIGLVKDTAPAELFRSWFPNHSNTVEYDSMDEALNALGHDKIDMVMGSQSQLLILTNYLELAGYKANVVFDRTFESTFGFNKNEANLCSIVDKALNLVDTQGIAGAWTRRTFDYRQKLAQAQLPWLIGASGLLLCVVALLIYLTRRRRQEGKILENLVENRTAELNKQHSIMYLVNDTATMLLETDTTDYLRVLDICMDMIGRCMEVDRVYMWRNRRDENGKLYYRQVCKWTREEWVDGSLAGEYSYAAALPRWEGLLSGGESINGPIEDLPAEEQLVLKSYQIQSMLVVPLFLKGEFWGYLSFDNCHSKHIFPETEVYAIHSWGLLVVGAIQRGEIAMHMQHTLNKLEAVTNNYKGIIWSVDRDGVIDTFNGQYIKTIGVSSSFLEGKKLEVARAKSRHLDIIDHVEKTFRDGPQDWLGDIDGGVFHSYTTPIYGSDGHAIGIVGSTDDVTETVRLQRDLETAVDAAEAASQAKSAFLANMSHEIRTPMNAIIGMVTIGKTAADIERKDYCFSKIEDASQHLLGVINDILDMSKIEASKFELSPAEFDFEKMLQRVVNVINFRVGEKRQELKIHIDSAIPKNLIGDDQRLAQVITNLLGNAVKFTPEKGMISLVAQLVAEENAMCTLQIAISDTGIGISQEQQSRLFQSFQQAESSTVRKFGGTGLGLSISKSIVDMMDGQIWVESELGKGSTFTFTVQVKRGTEKNQEEPDDTQVDWSYFRILTVDDDPDILAYFTEITKDFGITCDTALSGEVALQLVEQNGPYHIYFVDWKMPGMNGVELVRALKQREAATDEHTVAVMISSVEWDTIATEAKQAGVDKYLPKPLFPSAIAGIIAEYAGSDRGQAQQDTQQVIDQFPGRHLLLAEDIEINQEIVLALLEPTLLTIDCAENGAEALRMFEQAPGIYDMIFMDVQMPEMDGYEATRRIRALPAPQAKTIPIIAMTANVFREDMEKSLAAGMNAHIGKPLDLEEVLQILREYLA